ncbi:hypothetical protein [Mesorhizobium sp. M0478]|uniref:hypothetical protein n=1 Tax=Mesorhizobium sp. M0478 TaxID=2956947 RepID=UPI003338E899
MGSSLIAALWSALVIVVGNLAYNLAASELYAWCPKWADLLVKAASMRVPKRKRDRYREEWSADLNQIEGNIGKLFYGLRCFPAAWGISANRFGDDRFFSVERLLYGTGLFLVSTALEIFNDLHYGAPLLKLSMDALSLMACTFALWRGYQVRKRQRYIRIRGKRT